MLPVKSIDVCYTSVCPMSYMRLDCYAPSTLQGDIKQCCDPSICPVPLGRDLIGNLMLEVELKPAVSVARRMHIVSALSGRYLVQPASLVEII